MWPSILKQTKKPTHDGKNSNDQKGHSALETELKQLNRSNAQPSSKDVVAREHGDLSENAEYHSAREKQSFIEGRIKDLEGVLSLAEVIDPATPSGAIKFGATVT